MSTNNEYCRVYWGTHGCELPRGHEGHHKCICCKCKDHESQYNENGCVGTYPYYGSNTMLSGEDLDQSITLKRKSIHQSLSSIVSDLTDLMDTDLTREQIVKLQGITIALDMLTTELSEISNKL